MKDRTYKIAMNLKYDGYQGQLCINCVHFLIKKEDQRQQQVKQEKCKSACSRITKISD